MRDKNERMQQRVADDSVVVINPLPVKAGDSLEGKTKETVFLVILGIITQKVIVRAKGRR